jgi:uncharacterized membrane protein
MQSTKSFGAFLLAFAGGLGFNSWQLTVRSGPMIICAICLIVGFMFTLISAIAGHFSGGDAGGRCVLVAFMEPNPRMTSDRA